MVEKTMFKNMFKMQKYLNDKTNGTEWERLGINSNNGKKIRWWLCSTLELAEAIDSLDWKHWKSGEDDIDNLKVELVDTWHFIMSDIIASGRDQDLDKLFRESYREPFYSTVQSLETIDSGEEMKDFLITKMSQMISFAIDSQYDKSKLDDMATTLFYITALIGFSFKEFYLLYMGKNMLNEYRQCKGYAGGCYYKTWNGEEDNVHMTRWVKETLHKERCGISHIDVLRVNFNGAMDRIYWSDPRFSKKLD